MMRKEYKLSHFFLLFALLVLGLVSFVMYGRRTNAPSNINENGQDISAPFYEKTEKADAHHIEGHEAEGHHDDDPHGDEGHGH